MDQRAAQDVVLDVVERLAEHYEGWDTRVPQYRIVFVAQRAGMSREEVEHTLEGLFAAGILTRIVAVETEYYVPFGEDQPIAKCETIKIYYAFPDFE